MKRGKEGEEETDKQKEKNKGVIEKDGNNQINKLKSGNTNTSATMIKISKLICVHEFQILDRDKEKEKEKKLERR